MASRWQQYSPAPLRRLKRLFSSSSERNFSEHDDGWESDNDDLRRQQQRLKAAGADGSTSLSDTCPLLHSESPIASTSTDVKSDIGDQDNYGNVSLTSLNQNTYFKELSTIEHSQEFLQSHFTEVPLDTPESKPSFSFQTSPSLYDAQEAPGTVDERSYKFSQSTSNSSDFKKGYYVLTTGTEEEVGKTDVECCQEIEMTKWKQGDDNALVDNGYTTAVYDCTTSNAEIPSILHPEARSDSLSSLLSGKLDEEVACLLSNDCLEDNSGVIELRVSEASANVVSVVADMAQNSEDESSQNLEESVYDKEGMAVIGVGTKSELKECVNETDRAVTKPPSIVLDIPQTIDQPPSSSEVKTATADTISISDSRRHHHPPKLQLHISAATCTQPATRKSPVTVQEWVDSLPLHNR